MLINANSAEKLKRKPFADRKNYRSAEFFCAAHNDKNILFFE